VRFGRRLRQSAVSFLRKDYVAGDSTESGQSITEQSMSILLLFIDGGEHSLAVPGRSRGRWPVRYGGGMVVERDRALHRVRRRSKV